MPSWLSHKMFAPLREAQKLSSSLHDSLESSCLAEQSNCMPAVCCTC